MRFTVDHPVVVREFDPALVTADGMTRLARAVEELGYDALSFSEHPAPSQKWLDAGGHQSLDQTSALAFCAAVTRRIRLMTYLLVVPYHNPFLAAKALTTVDVLSSGRLTVVAGSGYLRSEFLALGVDFEKRNEIFDEAVQVMRGVWSEVPYAFDGDFFHARGVASLPAPVQQGGPPILVGGNGVIARQRAARLQGWSPIMVSSETAKTARTPGIASVEELGSRIQEVRAAAAEAGSPTTVIQAHTPHTVFLQKPGSVEEHRDHLGRLAEVGVDSFVLRPPADTIEHTLDALQEYAETFLG
ncbi:LLM class F420-dependent oxidoreductase [Nocardioides sp. cx-173]|uniref:LLM class F420-dependent oxidoreductase n=1 Tax=Nocardioides sp. cx-173 TaxID=2898796 RepID=UPI001E446504|nr:LLM class F420-dependent oxidoreductase [Nocardioides sp. cx-173]MCD4524267.1 LLM class F420-dependent oxidoreductase [Nocardioides sp. cx-173]UGB41659.1 LLM class F420-dependent oxidoreductase [Nocardioides sp. cx-173]